MRRAAVLVFVMMLLAAGAYADDFGPALIARSVVDTCSGCLFVYLPVPGVGTLDDWSFYSDSGSGNYITPILFQALTLPVFEVVAIGTTRTNQANGIQEYPFQPVSGSAVMGPNEYLGWVDGTNNGIVNTGTIPFDYSGEAVGYNYNGGSVITVGEQISFAPTNRTYSINGSTVPEPAYILLIGICLVGVGNRLRRRVR